MNSLLHYSIGKLFCSQYLSLGNIFHSVLVLSVFIGLVSCTQPKKPKPNPNLPPKYAVSVEPKFKHQGNLWFLDSKNDTISYIEIEIANTDAKREKGLMYRKSMKSNHGMLFIFPNERRQSFWMKETHISLDIIFINSEYEIVHIAENCQPYSLKTIPSFEYAQYVVEVNAGYCNELGVKVGNSITFKVIE